MVQWRDANEWSDSAIKYDKNGKPIPFPPEADVIPANQSWDKNGRILSPAKQMGKAKAHGSGAFTEKDINQGYLSHGTIEQPKDPDIKGPGDTVQMA